MLDSAFESVSDSASDSTSDSGFDSAFDSGVGSVIDDVVGLVGLAASSASLKVTFRLIRTALLTGFHSLNMVVASYSSSHSFSNRGAILPSSLVCGLSAYAAYLKVLICL
jgi:hypothetical protein